MTAGGGKPPAAGGVALVVALLMLVAVAMLGISAAQIALQEEKASRNERDRQLAFQAAEAALLDAELDIGGSPDEARSRSSVFNPFSLEGFAADCGAGENNRFQGLCAPPSGQPAAWLQVDLQETTPALARTVPYGRFTGRLFPVGQGNLPVQLPRYLIEALPDRAPGLAADAAPRYLYRITAIGFGVRPQTQVVLQSIYRKRG